MKWNGIDVVKCWNMYYSFKYNISYICINCIEYILERLKYISIMDSSYIVSYIVCYCVIYFVWIVKFCHQFITLEIKQIKQKDRARISTLDFVKYIQPHLNQRCSFNTIIMLTLHLVMDENVTPSKDICELFEHMA